jgi:membrane-associated protease RseP (regulator of RpoE activity)
MAVGVAADELFGADAGRAPASRPGVREERKTRAILLLAMALPVVALGVLPLGSVAAACMWMLGVAVAVPATIRLAAGREADPRVARKADTRMLSGDEVPAPVLDVMDVRIATAACGVWEFRGPLKTTAESASDRLAAAIPQVIVVRLEPDAELGAVIRFEPRAPRARSIARRLLRGVGALALFALTLVTTAFFGALGRGESPLEDPARLVVGLPYSLALLVVGMAHALARAIASRRHKTAFSPPYFLPLPFPPGTAGTLVKSGAPRDRRALFDHAAAGSLVALMAGLLILFFGLKASPVVLAREGASTPGLSVGSSMMLALVARLSIPEALTYGHHVVLTPLAVSAWLAILITAVHLLPVGSLDGGKMIRAMLGSLAGNRVARFARWAAVIVVALGRPAWLPVLIVVLLMTRGSPAPLDDLTPLPAGRWALGCVLFLALGLIAIPLPTELWAWAGIHMPQHADEAPAALRTIGYTP